MWNLLHPSIHPSMDYYVVNCFYKIFLISIFADLYKSWRWSNKQFSVQELIQVLFIFQEAGGCQETVANDISDFYAEKCNTPEVEQFCRVHNQLATNLMWEFVSFCYTPAQRSWRGGILDSPCPSVRPSVCRRHGFRSISQVC